MPTVFALAGGASTRLSAFDLRGSRISVKDGSTLGYLVPDLLGSVVATESSGSTAIASALRYDGYGRTAALTMPGGTVALDHRFTGAIDLSPDASPLYDIGARFYSPASGAWTQLDTYGGSAQDPVSMNRFLYAHANPTTLIDPTGHFIKKADEKVPAPEAKQRIQDNIRDYGNANGYAGGGGGGNSGGGADPPAGNIPTQPGAVLSGIWDSLSNNVINTVTFGVHAIQCGAINAYNPVTCPDFDHNVRMLTDERYRLETRQAEILALAEAFGDASDNLTSDDPYVSARAYTDVLTFAAFLAKGIAGARTGAARGAVVVRTPTVSDLAGDVANATGGSLRQLKGGFSVAVPYGKRGIVIRVMAEGGKRTNYYRVSIPGLKSFAVDGTVSTDKALTHIPIGETSLDDIIRLVNLIKGSE